VPLNPGTRLGPYEITGSLGAGGMGEVYKARDTRLDRTVAVKVLPEIFALDPTLRARFEREAKAISALNHPHICTLHDVGEERSTSFLVMEYVDGVPVSGPMPPARAIPIALQICDALVAAHRAGIVHRDLKPSNILVTKSGTVKLLDFGLAKALGRGGADDGAAAQVNVTRTSALTGAHTVIGTPQYMAPEQIEGHEADARTDVFALGCVLYELLTGTRAFEGATVSGVMAAILATEPRPLRELQPVTPPALEWIVSRCLAKDPDDRWQTVRDLRAALERVGQDAGGAAAVAPVATRSRLPWVAAAVGLALALAATLVAARMWSAAPEPDTRVFASQFVPPTSPIRAPALRLALSPDGTRLAYVAPDENGRVLLWVRRLEALTAQPLPGTFNASAPFWSPDSRFIAFQADGRLKKIDASGGAVITLCEALASPPGTWSRDDVILFSAPTGQLSRVSAAGGTPVPVTTLSEGERLHISPVFLPDGRHFLFASPLAGSRVGAIHVGSLDSPDVKVLMPSATSNSIYAEGSLLFLRGTTLMAQPFDPSTRTLSGEPRAIAEHVLINPTTGTGAFTVSQRGVLAYQTSMGGAGTSLVWVNRKGERLDGLGQPDIYLDVQLAPNGRRASVTVVSPDSRASDVWLLDVVRNIRTRYTFGPEPAAAALWSPDGSRLAYTVRRTSGTAIVVKSPTGAGSEEVLVDEMVDRYPLAWSPDGRYLLCNQTRGALSGTLCLISLDGDRTPRPFLNSGFSEIPAVFSPDGGWVAYVSDESGTKEVYVTSFPQPKEKWQVSTHGGDFPRWSHDGTEIFFLGADRLMASAVSVQGAELQVGAVRELFPVRWPVGTRSPYDVSRDGQRFLVNMADADPGATPITVVVNWTAKMRGEGR
jgi:eukaryotic-like serine/threonine-protein kinase